MSGRASERHQATEGRDMDRVSARRSRPCLARRHPLDTTGTRIGDRNLVATRDTDHWGAERHRVRRRPHAAPADRGPVRAADGAPEARAGSGLPEIAA